MTNLRKPWRIYAELHNSLELENPELSKEPTEIQKKTSTILQELFYSIYHNKMLKMLILGLQCMTI